MVQNFTEMPPDPPEEIFAVLYFHGTNAHHLDLQLIATPHMQICFSMLICHGSNFC